MIAARHILPLCLALVDFAEAAVCVWCHDYARSWYWAAQPGRLRSQRF